MARNSPATPRRETARLLALGRGTNPAPFAPSEFHHQARSAFFLQAVVATSNMRKAEIDNGSAPVRQGAKVGCS